MKPATASKEAVSFRGRCMVYHLREIWIDYQILQYALEEAEELADANWTEIKRLYARIDQLTAVLVDAGIAIPEDL